MVNYLNYCKSTKTDPSVRTLSSFSLSGMFIWDSTPERGTYWSDLNARRKDLI